MRPSDRRRPVALAVACAMGLVLWALPSAASADAGPAWRIVQATTPTNLVPGSEASGAEAATATPRLMLFMTNVGGATAGAAIVTDTLPAGLEASPSVMPQIGMSAGGDRTTEPCGVSGQTVTCEVTQFLPPGGVVQIVIPLVVSIDASGEVTNQASAFGGGAPAVSSNATATIGSERPSYGFSPGAGLRISAFDDAGQPPAAGSHPYDVEIGLEFSSVVDSGGEAPVEGLRNVRLALPGGLAVNPTAVPVRCTAAQISALVSKSGESTTSECPAASQVGVVETEIPGIGRGAYPLYAMATPPGRPAEFAYNYAGNAVIHILGGLDGDYRLSAESLDLLSHFPILAVDTFLWGNPSDSGHDPLRRGVGCSTGCSAEASPAPFLTMPSSCTEALEFKGTVTSWVGSEETRSAPLTDLEGNPIELHGCNGLEFEPTITAKATTNLADSPSGLDFNLHQPQNQQLDGLATAALKDAKVTLPAGMTLNASAANGLDSCTESQIGYQPEAGKIRFATTPQTCPSASKLGTLEVKTPLLEDKLPGAVYLAKPYENPFANLTAIYLAFEDKKAGIFAKLAGKVTPDPVTGQLSATFTENPQLPVEDIDLHFFNGAGAALTTPLTCGTKTTTSTLTPWSTPEGADVHPTDSFETQVAAGGSGPCPSSEANAPNAPAFDAGTIAPQAGAYSPFVLHLARKDGTQRLTGIDTTLPKGLAAKFAGIPYCSEAQIAQAQARSDPNQGALENASPSCPAASEVGTVTVGAGSGPTPTYVQGHAYLAGPYKGAPLSLAIITPAIAGPFDLGAVVVRTAIYVNPETAQGRAVSDPLPSIIAGVPLGIRSVSLKLDRPGGFALNPTSCDPMAVTGSATALTGQSAALTSPFQVGGCSALKFKPSLKISLKGGTKRHRFPALKAVLTYPKGNNANIASTQVTLPHGEFLEQGHIGTVCTRVQFAANACPKASIYGKARAITPLLDQPLEGPVYLRSSSHELPDLVAALDGQIDVVLAGRVDTGKGGGIRNTFEAVPDAPVSKFVLEMKGGKKGLLVNSEDICRRPQRASVSFTGQNGKAFDATPLIANSCKGKKKHAKKGAHGKKGHGAKKGGEGK